MCELFPFQAAHLGPGQRGASREHGTDVLNVTPRSEDQGMEWIGQGDLVKRRQLAVEVVGPGFSVVPATKVLDTVERTYVG